MPRRSVQRHRFQRTRLVARRCVVWPRKCSRKSEHVDPARGLNYRFVISCLVGHKHDLVWFSIAKIMHQNYDIDGAVSNGDTAASFHLASLPILKPSILTVPSLHYAPLTWQRYGGSGTGYQYWCRLIDWLLLLFTRVEGTTSCCLFTFSSRLNQTWAPHRLSQSIMSSTPK